jgi:hypothetical protein
LGIVRAFRIETIVGLSRGRFGAIASLFVSEVLRFRNRGLARKCEDEPTLEDPNAEVPVGIGVSAIRMTK